MSRLSITDKTLLEAVLSMGGGYLLDFTNSSIGQFFDDLGLNIFDDQYAEYGTSKAQRVRGFWKVGSDEDVARSLAALVGYIAAKKLTGSFPEIADEQVTKVREIATSLGGATAAPAASSHGSISTEATVTANRISIEIHEDIYDHIKRYLDSGDHFHAVEESYKVVREALRQLTGEEAAHKVFNENAQNQRHYAALFGKATPTAQAEGDFFRGVGYLHLGIQFLRNEKAHSLATFVEPNLAIHYISLASLAYDLITRSVNPAIAAEVEQLIGTARGSYSATAFYRVFANGKWMERLTLPPALASRSTRRALKQKWIDEADLSRSWNTSEAVFMRLQTVASEVMGEDIDRLLDLPTKDSYGNDQLAGLEPFLDFMVERHPEVLSDRAKERLAELKE
ncbi:MAG: TIGR02391 family protein [Micrococcales bacterium]|nr:TIGR02391 family protein [Micrococcales bacterium]OJX66131.1 MAG: TIGR02391 family protein [Micrococcales bacterium 72-143]